MGKEGTEYIENLILQRIMSLNSSESLNQATCVVEKLQNQFGMLKDKQNEKTVTMIKSMTVLLFGLLKKHANGSCLSELRKEDWKELFKGIWDYSFAMEESQYTQFVFSMYERYIRESADYIESYATEQTVIAIRSLADELFEKAELYKAEQLSEVDYIESCLWICLEAMIKLIASTAFRVLNNDSAEFVQAIMAYSFEYGRLVLYKREQEIINEYVQSQYKLDAELERKYHKFIEELEEQSKQFYTMIENAFVSDFRERFFGSVSLARAVGVREADVLKKIEDIDSFFEE